VQHFSTSVVTWWAKAPLARSFRYEPLS
jgi:hypothetical protein